MICRNGKWNEGSEIEIATNFKKCDETNKGDVLNGYICAFSWYDTYPKWRELTVADIAVNYKLCTEENEYEIVNNYICRPFVGRSLYNWALPSELEKELDKYCTPLNENEIVDNYKCSCIAGGTRNCEWKNKD